MISGFAFALIVGLLQPPLANPPPTEPPRSETGGPQPPTTTPSPTRPPDPGPTRGDVPSAAGMGAPTFGTGFFPFGATMATSDHNGNLSIDLVVSEFIPETAVRTVPTQRPDGRTEYRTETITVVRSIVKSEKRALPPGVKVYRNGRELSAEERRALRAPVPIFITALGGPDRPPGQGFEAILRDALVAHVPAAAGVFSTGTRDSTAMRSPDPGRPTPTPAAPPTAGTPPAPGDASPDEREVFEKANAERAAAGAPPLKIDPTLMKAARQHSANMAKQGKLDHVLDGKGPRERLTDLGIQPTFTGENCAQGQRSGAEAMQGWMGSDGHRGNVLNPDYTHIGVGKADGENGPYWTQVFARLDRP